MKAQNVEGLSINDLEAQRAGLEGRIQKLERDLKQPLEQDFSEQAGQISNQLILRRLLEVERANLHKVNFEIEKFKQAFNQGQNSVRG